MKTIKNDNAARIAETIWNYISDKNLKRTWLYWKLNRRNCRIWETIATDDEFGWREPAWDRYSDRTDLRIQQAMHLLDNWYNLFDPD